MQQNSPIEEDICCEDRTRAQFQTDYPREVGTCKFPSFNILTMALGGWRRADKCSFAPG